MLIAKRIGAWRRLGWRVRALVVLGAVLALVLAVPQSVNAQATAFDHGRFDALLKAHVVRGFVDYDAFARAPEFREYLAALDRATPKALDDDERLAFWINAFNAYTIALIVEHHELQSIRNINRTLGFLQLNGPWNEPIVRVGGERYSLDQVHHAILRKEFGESRVHFTLACGAVGCPPLRSEAYTGARLVEQFESQARTFLRDSPTKNRVEGRMIVLSPVLMAYRNDFGPGRDDLARALAPYFDGELRKRLGEGRAFFRTSEFDWSLNSLALARSKHLLDSVSTGKM